MVGLEPTSLTAADFKSAVFTISPHGRCSFIIARIFQKSTKKWARRDSNPQNLVSKTNTYANSVTRPF